MDRFIILSSAMKSARTVTESLNIQACIYRVTGESSSALPFGSGGLHSQPWNHAQAAMHHSPADNLQIFSMHSSLKWVVQVWHCVAAPWHQMPPVISIRQARALAVGLHLTLPSLLPGIWSRRISCWYQPFKTGKWSNIQFVLFYFRGYPCHGHRGRIPLRRAEWATQSWRFLTLD